MYTSTLPNPSVDPTLLLRSALERIRLLEAEVLRLRPVSSQGDKTIRVFHAGRLIRVPLATILYFKAESNYTRIFLNGGEQYYVSRTLKSWIAEMHDDTFIRCHRSYLINKKEITEISRTTGELFLKNGACVPTSRRFQRASVNAIFGGDAHDGRLSLAKPDCTVYKLNHKGAKTGFYI